MPISFPPGPDKNNGMLKFLAHNENETLNITYSSFDSGHPTTIFPLAPLDINDSTYFQTQSTEDEVFYSISFKKRLFITHFSIKAKDFEIPWYPNNWRITGCLESKCNDIAKEPYNNSLNTKQIKRFPVVPGLYDNFTFFAYSCIKRFWTIQYLDLFGFICNNQYDCNGNILYRRCTRGKNRISSSFTLITLSLMS